MDFFGDFCLSCDAQTNGSAFCSQACRLAELDHYTKSIPLSPGQSDTSNRRRSNGSQSSFYLPPAIDFSLYKSSSASSSDTSKSTKSNAKISEQAQSDLNNYFTSFDQTRALRRRVSMQSSDDEKIAQSSQKRR